MSNKRAHVEADSDSDSDSENEPEQVFQDEVVKRLCGLKMATDAISNSYDAQIENCLSLINRWGPFYVVNLGVHMCQDQPIALLPTLKAARMLVVRLGDFLDKQHLDVAYTINVPNCAHPPLDKTNYHLAELVDISDDALLKRFSKCIQDSAKNTTDEAWVKRVNEHLDQATQNT
jgi:hypothetical protein